MDFELLYGYVINVEFFDLFCVSKVGRGRVGGQAGGVTN